MGLVALSGAAVTPAFAPLLPPGTTVAYLQATGLSMPRIENRRASALPQLLADRFGWPEMAAAVARAYHALPPADRERCAIFGQDYGQAAHRPVRPAPRAPKALSGHLTYWYWGPRGFTGEVMLVMGDERENLEGALRGSRSGWRGRPPPRHGVAALHAAPVPRAARLDARAALAAPEGVGLSRGAGTS